MKAKVMFGVAGLLVLLLLVVVLPGPRRAAPEALPAAADQNSVSPMNTESAETKPAAAAAPAVSAPVASVKAEAHDPAKAPLAGTQKLDVQARAEELMGLAMNNDPGSLEAILRELQNPDRALRQAAVQAVIQFGSREAIPRLAEAAQQTDEASEKAEILEAIEFLKLPSLSEVMAKGASRPAAQAAANR